MDIYYLHNSGFAVFLEKSLLVFDYYKTVTESRNKNVAGGIISPEDLNKKENIYVFASHSHPDHFNPAIFNWQHASRNIRYFLDKEIHKNKTAQNVVSMQKGDVYEDRDIRVLAFGSTDIGSSFYLETEGLHIFHAGDLNYWHWRDSSTPAYVETAGRDFYMEMSMIERNAGALDIAFFPVDPAMGEGYDEGAVYFIEAMRPKYFIPMHCRGPLDTFEVFKNKMRGSGTTVLTYRQRGEKLTIE